MSVLMGLGSSSEINVYAAGQEAARQMVGQLGGLPQLTLVFGALRYCDPRMLRGVRSVTEDAPLIGCSSAGGISTGGYLRQHVIVIGFRGAGVSFVTGVAHGVSKEPEAAGKRLAADLKAGEPAKIKAALIFPDGLATNGSALLRGLQKGLTADVPIIGSLAGDDFHFQRTFQFLDDTVLTDSMPGVLFCGEIALGIGVRHGWVPLGQPKRITKAHGSTLYELDGKPAVTIFEHYLGAKRKALRQKSLSHVALTYPLGLSSGPDTECLLRNAVGVSENGALICNGEFPEGRWVRLMIGRHESALQAAQEAASQAAEAIGRHRFKGALVFSSGGRQKMLGSECQDEIDVIRDNLGGVGMRLGGFYGYGEQAPVDSANMFHNESIVVMSLG